MTAVRPRRLALAHLPTPLWRSDALDALVGTSVWVKRDDMTAGAAAGNKIRKLEYLLKDALDRQATTVLTCGGIQSNHARATALLSSQLGLRSVLFLRTANPAAPPEPSGNLMLNRLAGAETRFITPQQYQRREQLMDEAAAELADRGENPYLIPEGGSNGLGALGYVSAMREIRRQLDLGLGAGPEPFDAVAHACGSGGTAAGAVLGAAMYRVAPTVYAMAVCDDRPTFEASIGRIVADARKLISGPTPSSDLVVSDQHKGPAYAVASDEQREFIATVARRCGLVLDPAYTGKALFALSKLEPKPGRVLFLHTGGLPGLLAQATEFDPTWESA